MWAVDGQTFALGALDSKRGICTFNTEGEELVQWNKKHRVQALCGSADGRWLVAADNLSTLWVYSAATRQLEYELDLGTRPHCLAMSQDCRHLLVNKGNNEAQVIDLTTKAIVQKFVSHKMGDCIIRASFGGANESFVVSGSEDGNVFIWHRGLGLVERLAGHASRCNSVNWNPTDPCMLASCGDDGLIKM